MTYGLNSIPPDINPTESWVDYCIRLKQTCDIGTLEAARIADKQVLLRDIKEITLTIPHMLKDGEVNHHEPIGLVTITRAHYQSLTLPVHEEKNRG